jgi:DNA-binding NarL/FixJ family response regulator
MMDNGASGYLLKNATQEEILTGIATVMKGKLYLSAEAATSLQQSRQEIPVLTRREKEVLELIASGMTNNEIATKLFVSVATVDTHRKNLLAKFDARNIAMLIKTAVQLQLI